MAKVEIAWHEILDASRHISILVKNLIRQGDIERARAASKIARQLKPEADLWQLMYQDLSAKHGVRGEHGYEIEPGSEGSALFRKELGEMATQATSLKIDPIQVSRDEVSAWAELAGGPEMFIALGPIIEVVVEDEEPPL